MPSVLVNIDVDDMERAVAFYTQGLGLGMGRRFDGGFVELVGAEISLFLLLKAASSSEMLRDRLRRCPRETP